MLKYKYLIFGKLMHLKENFAYPRIKQCFPKSLVISSLYNVQLRHLALCILFLAIWVFCYEARYIRYPISLLLSPTSDNTW